MDCIPEWWSVDWENIKPKSMPRRWDQHDVFGTWGALLWGICVSLYLDHQFGCSMEVFSEGPPKGTPTVGLCDMFWQAEQVAFCGGLGFAAFAGSEQRVKQR